MPAHDERAELASRDIVAHAIDFEMNGETAVTDRQQRAAAPREPRPALQPGLSGHLAEGTADGAGAGQKDAGTALTD